MTDDDARERALEEQITGGGQEAEQWEKNPEAGAQDAEAEEESHGPKIPDDLAVAIFNQRREIRRRGVALESAKGTAKLRKQEYDQAGGRLLELIDEAESGQTRLFESTAPVEDDDEPTDVDDVDELVAEFDSARQEREAGDVDEPDFDDSDEAELKET